jgi:hypothetical protein
MIRHLSVRTRAWIALLLPPVAWFVFEQGLSALLHARCEAAQIGMMWGVASLVLCAAAVRFAWRLKAREGELANPWLARLAIPEAGIFSLAILFQMLAVSLVPPCAG